jgi:endonuclease-3
MDIPKVLDTLKKYYRVEPFTGEESQGSIFRILISTILSQNCSDTNSERAARQLFRKYRTPGAIAGAPVRELERLVKPSGFFKVKARRIKEVSRIILKKYGGKVPDSTGELVKIPGVGRKTAGCVMVYGFSRAEGIPVDTHVHRVSNRLGLVRTKQREKTEQALMELVPRKYWILVNEVFVLHGKNICRAGNPRCWECPVSKYCRYYYTIYNKGKGKPGKIRTKRTMLRRMRRGK